MYICGNNKTYYFLQLIYAKIISCLQVSKCYPIDLCKFYIPGLNKCFIFNLKNNAGLALIVSKGTMQATNGENQSVVPCCCKAF